MSNKETCKSWSFVFCAAKDERSRENCGTKHNFSLSEARRMEPYDLQVETFVRLPSIIKSNRRDGGGREAKTLNKG